MDQGREEASDCKLDTISLHILPRRRSPFLWRLSRPGMVNWLQESGDWFSMLQIHEETPGRRSNGQTVSGPQRDPGIFAFEYREG